MQKKVVLYLRCIKLVSFHEVEKKIDIYIDDNSKTEKFTVNQSIWKELQKVDVIIVADGNSYLISNAKLKIFSGL